MGALAKTVTESEALRKVAIPAYRMYARAMVFNRGPRVLANSMPKTGTHLVAALLKNLPHMLFSGRHHTLPQFELPGAPRATERRGVWKVDWDRLERSLAAVNHGQYMTAHFAPAPELLAMLEKLEYRNIIIMRDPRDAAVSSAFYITRLKRHFLHERYNTEFHAPGERIMASITGLPPTDRYRGLGSIGSRAGRYRQWFDVPNTYGCRFEDLIGPSGGGDAVKQLEVVTAIARHVDREVSDDEAQRLAHRTWSQASSTFRKGTIGDWRNHFTEEHKKAFKEVAGVELIKLGYEKDYDW